MRQELSGDPTVTVHGFVVWSGNDFCGLCGGAAGHPIHEPVPLGLQVELGALSRAVQELDRAIRGLHLAVGFAVAGIVLFTLWLLWWRS